jgi:hypothetical protein
MDCTLTDLPLWSFEPRFIRTTFLSHLLPFAPPVVRTTILTHLFFAANRSRCFFECFVVVFLLKMWQDASESGSAGFFVGEFFGT